MKEEERKELERLREDYNHEAGKPFRWFYCPFLFCDEDVELCKGHLLNQAFVGSSRASTIQRKDLDNFYGRIFEGDFVLIQDLGSASFERVIESPELVKKVPVKASFKNVQVDSYPYKRGPVPKEHTRFEIDGSSGRTLSMVLKIAPDEVAENTASENWQFSVEKDLRLESLVSLMKAAHLTLFKMLGYNYALSAGGHFTGWIALGSFFMNNDASNNGTYLRTPALTSGSLKTWCVRSFRTRLCLRARSRTNSYIFAKQPMAFAGPFIVFIRLPGSLHSVVIPILDHPEGAARFHGFLDAVESTLIVRFCKYESGIFQAHHTTTLLKWPGVSLSPTIPLSRTN